MDRQATDRVTVDGKAQVRPTWRARLQPWRCQGTRKKDGQPCNAILLESDPSCPCPIRKVCDKCGKDNVRHLSQHGAGHVCEGSATLPT